MRIRSLIFGLWTLMVFLGLASAAAQDGSYSLTVMHTNDTRANHLPTSDGIGGAARQATVVNQIRSDVDNTLLLDAGGRFTGTLFHRVYVGQDNVRLMNVLGYQAMALGSTEFDNGDQALAQFIAGLNFPVLAANVDASRSEFLADSLQPATVIEIGGERIGIVGLAPANTPRLSSPSPVILFNSDFLGVAQAEVNRLRDEGIDKIILLSYLGYDEDLALAPQLVGVDLIVGGNTRTLLSNTQPDAEGPYPAALTGADGSPILIVQSGGGARGELRFMGRLDLTFDADGVLTAWSGDTILLDASIEPDPDVQALLDELSEEVEIERRRMVRTPAGDPVTVTTTHDVSACRVYECALGNLVADALRWQTGAQLALMNGGGMRGGLEAGDLLRGAILEFLPFSNQLTTFSLRGADFVLALENGVSRIGESSGTGRFPQVSGLRYTYDLAQPALSRIVSVEVQGSDGSYVPLDPEAIYTVVTNDFLRRGGDGYQVFADRAIDPVDALVFFDDVLQRYAREHSPLDPQLEGRITVLNAPTPTPGA